VTAALADAGGELHRPCTLHRPTYPIGSATS
jgi:hypothetical protein